MSGTIIVNYDEVYRLVQTWREFIQSDILDESQNRYREIVDMLSRVDGATNAQLKAAMELNRQKTTTAAETIKKLLYFIEDSARELQNEENKMAGQLKAEAGQEAK